MRGTGGYNEGDGKIRLHILLTTCYFMVGIFLYNYNPNAIFTVLLVSFLSVCAYVWGMVGMYKDMENLDRLEEHLIK